MQKAYNRINWANYPSEETPLNEANLNKMDAAINELDDRVLTHEITKANQAEVSELFSGIAFDESTGIMTFTRKNGGTVKIDTKLEKLAVNFSYDAENERLVITLDDGSVQYVDMKALITQYEFVESDTIILSVDSSGKVSASIKLGSITGEMLEPNYLANVTVQAESATASASAAASSASEAANSAAEAKAAAERAETVSQVEIATTSKAGIVKPDGSTITIDADGTLHGASAYTHPNSGVSAGTYRKVTVDAKGHVTGGSNPTTTIEEGGTGATTAAAARTNLGLGSAATASTTSSITSGSSSLITSGAVYDGLAGKAGTSHNQAASTITAGTLGGKVQANASAMATLTNAQVRDIVILSSDPGEGASVSYPNGTIVFTK